MSLYALDVTKYEKNAGHHGNILITNIKRWNAISLNNNFTISKKHNKILLLFDVYCSIKNKILMLSQQIQKQIENSNSNINNYRDQLQKQLEIITYFEDIEVLIYFDNFDSIIRLSIESYQVKILNTIRKIIGDEEFIIKIKEFYPTLITDKNITSDKICKNYVIQFQS